MVSSPFKVLVGAFVSKCNIGVIVSPLEIEPDSGVLLHLLGYFCNNIGQQSFGRSIHDFLTYNFPLNPSCPSVGWSVGLLVRQSLVISRSYNSMRSYQSSTCFFSVLGTQNHQI